MGETIHIKGDKKMALKKDISYKTLPVKDAYLKIISVDIHDEMITIDLQQTKVYHVSLRVRFYTNEDKSYRLKIETYPFSFESEKDLTLVNFYTSLKEHEDFKNAVDC
jgi:hypothetical protein